ncbi:MAG TPA: adenylate/guanylate cyclase domain-containing protein [Burkholderiaceae bacterium]|nr:adenylate/guanylate cyclase domain-containing protein [Burkholderiaceae bacterium]
MRNDGVADAAEAAGLQRARRAIVVVDLVESVRLMREAEAEVIARWRAFVDRVRQDVLPLHRGRLVKSLGDGLLLVFDDAGAAVAAGMSLHGLVGAAPLGTPALQLRVGIHLAEVLLDDLDVYGSGVNLAARLAGVGRPGDTVVSAEVRDQLVDGLHGRVVDLGDCYLKHWSEPVRAFRLVAADATPLGAHADHFLDDRPSVAVIPFATPGVAMALGDALAESIVTALSGNRSLRVISLLSTRAFRHGVIDLATVRRTLGVAYLVTGSVHAAGDRLQISAQLCNTRDGQVQRSVRVATDAGAVFSPGDDPMGAFAREVSTEIVRTEVRLVRALPLANLESYSLYLGGVYLLHRLARRDFERAREVFDHLAERHPRSAAPHAMLAKWNVLRAVQGWADDRRQAGRLAQASARRAVDLDPDHALALSMEAIVVAQVDGDLERARQLGEAAVNADPQESHAWVNLGGIHSYLGHADPAQSMPQRAIELSPMDPARFAFEAFLAEGRLTARQFEAAVSAAQGSIRLNARHTTSHRILTIALALAGRIPEARNAAGDLLRLSPGFCVGAYQRGYAGRELPHLAERLDALRAAGVPD